MVLSCIFCPWIVSALQHLDEVGDLVDHAANSRRVFQHAGAVQLAKAQANHGGAVRSTRTDGAANQLDRYSFLVRHVLLLAISRRSLRPTCHAWRRLPRPS